MPGCNPALFEAFGVELEYMIVDARTLDVRPIADVVLRDAANNVTGEVERGAFGWSNELVSHVVELKVSAPAPRLEGLAEGFLDQVEEINARLALHQACLMPGGMHPWMDPARETVLWPHDGAETYSAFDRAFGCNGHGWSNLQSAHLNLPFQNDEQFGRLHAAVRLVLPILPALAASSPFVERQAAGALDHRLAVYFTNCGRVPMVSGRVVPEAVFTQGDYERQILAPLYEQMRPHDPQGLLRHVWLNARGAIARFTRNSLEVRLLDVQECPAADLAICAALVAVLKSLVAERFCSFDRQKSFDAAPLERILRANVINADQAIVDDPKYLEAFGLDAPVAAGALWRFILQRAECWHPLAPVHRRPLELILNEGPLARRILRAVDAARDQEPDPLAAVYRQLCACLRLGELLKA
jgi:gamma-glutamyl:cysteine ligase YbdK (ATP-grasp superfamily)